MRRSRQVVLVMAVLVLCAGVVVGRLSARLASEERPLPPGHSPSWLADQLDLSTDQRQQMDAIWANVHQQIGNNGEKRHDLERERDDAIRALLSDQQEAAYQAIYEEYHEKRLEMDKTRDALIKSAEDKSRALLNDSQKARWDVLSKEMPGHHGPGPGGGGFGPTSRPWSGDHGPDDHGHPDGESPDHEAGNHGPPDHGPPGM
jgi:hypothetical protein